MADPSKKFAVGPVEVRYWQEFAKSTIISFLFVTLIEDEKGLRLTFLVIAFALGLGLAYSLGLIIELCMSLVAWHTAPPRPASCFALNKLLQR